MEASTSRQQFASDNYAGICPSAWQALAEANQGHAVAYGDDDWTTRASRQLADLFGVDCQVFFVFNGTAGNALALASLCRSYDAVICHRFAHIETDECSAPAFFSGGLRLLPGDGADGKLTVAAVERLVKRRTDVHFPRAKVLSLTQPTEAGTLYTPDELHELGDCARRHGLYLHLDGARLANAVAALGCSVRELTVDCGVDVLCLGGTKNGMAVGDAVIFFHRELADGFARRCKQAGQLASKMRFLAAPWATMLRDGSWLANARHANRCLARLVERLRVMNGVDILFEARANTVFVRLAEPVLTRLAEQGWRFYVFPEVGGARFMCSWDTEIKSVDRFADALEAARAEQDGDR